jgi:multiple sugar transport system permease protein
MKSSRKENIFPLAVLFITLIFLVMVQGYPLLWSFNVSLTNQKIGTTGNFVGLKNFSTLFSEQAFWQAMGFTLMYTGSAIFFKLLLGMIMAVTLNQPLKGRTLFRALLFLPWALPTLTSVLSWRWMLGDIGGVVNFFFMKLHLISRPVGWLGNIHLARMSVILVNVWRGTPFFGISILAALQAIPDYLYEVAIIDGAKAWQRFIYITIPSIKNVILLVVLVSTIWTLGDFVIIWLMTRGGPANATHVFSTFSYITAFQNLEIAKGVSISLVIIPFSLLLMFFTMKFIFSERE